MKNGLMNGLTRAQAQAHLDAIFATGTPKATSAAEFLFAPTDVPMKAEPIAAPVRNEPKPLLVARIVVSPDSAKGQTFVAYPVLSVKNQANGRFHRDVRLSQRYLDAVVAYVKANGSRL